LKQKCRNQPQRKNDNWRGTNGKKQSNNLGCGDGGGEIEGEDVKCEHRGKGEHHLGRDGTGRTLCGCKKEPRMTPSSGSNGGGWEKARGPEKKDELALTNVLKRSSRKKTKLRY